MEKVSPFSSDRIARSARRESESFMVYYDVRRRVNESRKAAGCCWPSSLLFPHLKKIRTHEVFVSSADVLELQGQISFVD